MKPTLAVAITLVFTVLLGALMAVLVLVNVATTSQVLIRAADRVVVAAEREMDITIRHRVEPIRALTRQWSLGPAARARTWTGREVFFPAMRAALDAHPQVTAIQYGYDNGDFFILRAPDNPAVMSVLGAPESTVYVIDDLTLSGAGTALGIRVFQDGEGVELGRARLRDIDYDPRLRPWYRDAMTAGDVAATRPYYFRFMQTPGITVAVPVEAGNGVVGLDIALTELDRLLRQADIAPSQELALIDADGAVLAYNRNTSYVRQTPGGAVGLAHLSDLDAAAINRLVDRSDRVLPMPDFGQPVTTLDGRDWMTSVRPIVSIGWFELFLVLAVPEDEVLAETRAVIRETLMLFGLALLVVLPLLWLAASRVARPLRRLRDETAAILRFDMRGDGPGRSLVQEVDALAVAMGLMKRTLQRFMDLTTSIASEGDLGSIARRVTAETLSVTRSKAAAVLLVGEDGRTLTVAHMLVAGPEGEARNVAVPAGAVSPGEWLRAMLRPVNPAAGVANSFGRGAIRTFSLSRAMADPLGCHLLDAVGQDIAGVASISLTNPRGAWLGTILVVRDPADPGRETIDPSSPRLCFCEALAQLVAITIEEKSLLERHKRLLDAIVEMIASAVDAKSPYTGGHCRRVSDLALRLTEAATRSSEPAFAAFRPDTAAWETIRIAAWLHDCGKITTPEHVIDKATKLETITNRIHEIRTRFEVLKRDAEIAYWRAEARARGVLPDGMAVDADAPADWRTVRERQARLDEDFAFVAGCNTGGEFMDEADIDRLSAIGQRCWLRTLDDRLGLSAAEAKAVECRPPTSLPAQERLLADKPEHCQPRLALPRAAAADNPWGFRLDLPASAMDRGELHNLSIRRGTLTAEERAIVNDHVVQTIIMLSQLPFPKELARVSDIAGAHHEKLDGTGYPRRWAADGMDLPMRILAVADIFEALTAADRPYRLSKSLSEALKILASMVRDGHIDGDLYRLLLTSGIYRAYAEANLRPEQIDPVNVDRLLATAGVRAPPMAAE